MIASDAAASVRHVGRVSTGVRAWLRMSGAGGLSFLGACLFAAAASAGSDAPRTETFTGVNASDNYSSGYVGGSYALSKTGALRARLSPPRGRGLRPLSLWRNAPRR